MHVVAIIQARMGSSRLPGKVMLSLDCVPVLSHVIRRVAEATTVDDVVVATSAQKQDDIVARRAADDGVDVHRGSEEDVLGRMYDAATEAGADAIVRVTSDCPLLEYRVIDAAISRLRTTGADYVNNSRVERTFPLGLDVEAFTMSSFDRVRRRATDAYEREHVTPYYYEQPSEFDIETIRSTDVFDDSDLQNRTDLRLTLDEDPDYQLLQTVFENISFHSILEFETAVRHIDDQQLGEINREITQKSPTE